MISGEFFSCQFFSFYFLVFCACFKNLIYILVSRCDNDNNSTGPLETEVIPVLHSVAEVNTSDESDGVAKQDDDQMGIFQILDKLDVAVDALLNTTVVQTCRIHNWK